MFQFQPAFCYCRPSIHNHELEIQFCHAKCFGIVFFMEVTSNTQT